MLKNFIIDLCGPLLVVDTKKIDRHFNRLGVVEERCYHKLYYEGRVKEFDKGLISPAEFCDNAREVLGCSLDDNAILEAWNDLIVDFDTRNIAALRSLGQFGRLFLLSNSDVVNEACFRQYINNVAGMDLFNDIFAGVCFSNSTGLRKPDPAIFQHVADNNGLTPGETLVVDDCRQHCESARSIGMQSFLCDGKLFTKISVIINML